MSALLVKSVLEVAVASSTNSTFHSLSPLTEFFLNNNSEKSILFPLTMEINSMPVIQNNKCYKLVCDAGHKEAALT